MRYGKKKYFVKMSEKVIVTDVVLMKGKVISLYIFIFLFFSALVLFVCFLACISFFIFVLKPIELL